MKIKLHIISLIVSMCAMEMCFSQSIDSIPVEDGTMQALSAIGTVQIILKKETKIKNCIVKEIQPNTIVYERDGTLHDLQIEKIERIDMEMNSTKAIFFDGENKPMIMSIEMQSTTVQNTDVKKDSIVQDAEVIKVSISEKTRQNDYYTQDKSNEKYSSKNLSDRKGYKKGTHRQKTMQPGNGWIVVGIVTTLIYLIAAIAGS